MSGSMAFLSFANFIRESLTGTGITVAIEKHTTETPPYLILQDGPDRIVSKWLSSRLCQGWLVVERIGTEPLIVTAGKRLDQVVLTAQDPGYIEKWDYSQNPKQLIGSVIAKVVEVTGDMSNDPLRSRRVITWELHSNSG